MTRTTTAVALPDEGVYDRSSGNGHAPVPFHNNGDGEENGDPHVHVEGQFEIVEMPAPAEPINSRIFVRDGNIPPEVTLPATICLAMDVGSRNTCLYYWVKGRFYETVTRHEDDTCLAFIYEDTTVIDQYGISHTVKREKTIAFGKEAKAMIGYRSDITVVWPVKDGISRGETQYVKQIMQHMLKLVPGCHTGVADPDLDLEVILGVPEGRQADGYVLEQKEIWLNDFGAVKVDIGLQQVFAAKGVPGATLEDEDVGVFADIGGETVDINLQKGILVISATSVEVGSSHIDSKIVAFVDMTFNLFITLQEAERIKIAMGNFSGVELDLPFVLADCRDGKYKEEGVPFTGLYRGSKVVPEIFPVRAFDSLTKEFREEVTRRIHQVLSGIPDTLDQVAKRVNEQTLKFTGNGAKLRGLCEMTTTKEVGPSEVVQDPGDCVVRGMAVYAQDPEVLHKATIHHFSRVKPKKAKGFFGWFRRSR